MASSRMAIASFAASGDDIGALRALRDKIATLIDGSDDAMEVSTLTRSLLHVQDRISMLAPARTRKRDEVAAKRAERRKLAANRRPDSTDSGSAVGQD